MARIPISAIPNAPQAAGPALAPALPGLSKRSPVDVGPGLDPSGLNRAQSLLEGASASIQRSSSNVARATAANQQELLDVRDYTQGDRALAFAGAAVAKAGGVVVQFANDMALAKDSMDMTRVDGILRDARDQHRLWVTENQVNPAQWVPKWNESFPDVEKRIEGLGVSGRIKGVVQENVARFWTEQTTGFALEATKKSLTDASAEAEAGVSRAFFDGDWEIADQLITENQNTGIFPADKAQVMREALTGKQREQWIGTAINADPDTVAEITDKALKDGGKVEGFDWLDAGKDPVAVRRINDAARQQSRQYKIDALDNLDTSIIAGEYTTPEQVRTFGEENRLDEKDIQARLEGLNLIVAQTPAGQAKYKSNWLNLWQEVNSYDPLEDKSGELMLGLRRRVQGELLPGERDLFNERINSRYREGIKPNEHIGKALNDQIDARLKQGLLGPLGMDKEGKKVTDWQASVATSTAAQRLYQRVDDWTSSHPQATPDEAMKWFYSQPEIVNGPANAVPTFGKDNPSAKKPSDSQWDLRNWLPFSGSNAAPTKDQIQQMKGSPSAMKTGSDQTARTIVDYEARRDKQGNLAVYKLPSGDGGGTYEIAGINDKYHPQEAAKLKSLVESGRSDEAEAEAVRYIAQYTSAVGDKAENPGVRFALQDAAFNRGPTGAVRIMQKALGVKVDGQWGPKTQAAFNAAEKTPKALLSEFRSAREWYERSKYVGRSESSKFWKGLENRWNNQLRDAEAMA